MGKRKGQGTERNISVINIEVTGRAEKKILEYWFSNVVTHIVTGSLYRVKERWQLSGKVVDKSLEV